MKYIYQTKNALACLSKDAAKKELLAMPLVKQVGLRLKDASELREDGAIVETFRVTDAGIDREGDIIVTAGMDTAAYETSGSLLWGHRADSPELILGAPESIVRGETSLDIAFRFATEDENPTGAMVGRMVRAGLVAGTSVGILIKEFTEATDRGGFMPLNILRSELLEVSVTPIPANPRAVRHEASTDETNIDETLEIAEELDPDLAAAFREVCERTNKEDTAVPTDPMVAAFVKALGKKG